MPIFALDTSFELMKTAIIILGNSWVCPYLNTYKRAFDKLGHAYDVILWDRDGSDSSAPIRFCSGDTNLDNPLLKSISYIRYSKFIKKTVLKNRYDKLVVSGPHLAILLSSFLRKRYKGQYIIDYRDISIEQKPMLRGCYSRVLADSFCNIISSPGFRKYLPREYKYLISHNFDFDVAVSSLKEECSCRENKKPLNILTIGYIRNYSSNVKIIQSLGNNVDYHLKFVGRGDASASLEDFSLSHDVINVEFSGFYKKDDEAAIVKGCDLINIFFPNDMEHSSIMSNRFYLALIYKKPVIVTAGSIQADFVKDFNLGVVVDNCNTLDADIKTYLADFDYLAFCKKCNELLGAFVEEHRSLEHAISDFVKS